ncbi:hypothetical protein [Amycolatopsis sp. NPDC004169]|uniref:hypothetical protein n=1 Tax=Amycolatopsis sp. NPDC004169 TaxID=3154453 RepID=UPI0033B17FA9
MTAVEERPGTRPRPEVAAARQAAAGRAPTPGRERARVPHRVADPVRANADELATLESTGAGHDAAAERGEQLRRRVRGGLDDAAPAGPVAAGRFPLGKLVTHHDFGQIQQAADDMVGGRTSKPVLRW